MATYSRSDVTALSNRLETRAAAMCEVAGRDIKAAALLLRRMLELSDIEKIEKGGAHAS